MHHDVCSQFNRADKIRRAESVVDNQGDAMAVGNLRQLFNVGNVGIGIAQGLHVESLCILLDGAIYSIKVMHVDKSGGDPRCDSVWVIRLYVPPYRLSAATIWSPF